jgi:hypothetical protein
MEEKAVDHGVNNEPIYLSDVKNVSQFFLTPNGKEFFEKEILKTGIASLLHKANAKELSPHLSKKWNKVRNFEAYKHPMDERISQLAVWKEFAPQIPELLHELKQATPSFDTYCKLYLAQESFPSYMTKRILLMRQMESKAPQDPLILQKDISLFGFHNLREWFSDSFLDLVSLYLIKVASYAKKEGIQIPQKDLAVFLEKSSATRTTPALETMARTILSYQSLTSQADFFPSLDEAFHAFADEKVEIEKVTIPSFYNEQNKYAIAYYMKSIFDSFSPEKIKKGNEKSIEQLEKETPDLIWQEVKLAVQSVNIDQLALSIPSKEMLKWQISDAGWAILQREFNVAAKENEVRLETFSRLDKSDKKKIDLFTRQHLANNKETISAALEKAPVNVTTAHLSKHFSDVPYGIDPEFLQTLSINEPAKITQTNNTFYRIQLLEKGNQEIVPLEKAISLKILDKIFDQFLERQLAHFQEKGDLFKKDISFEKAKDKLCHTLFGYGFSNVDFAKAIKKLSLSNQNEIPIHLLGLEKESLQVTRSQENYIAAFVLEVGETSPIQKTEEGLYWFMVKEKTRDKQMDVDHQGLCNEIKRKQAELFLKKLTLSLDTIAPHVS